MQYISPDAFYGASSGGSGLTYTQYPAPAAGSVGPGVFSGTVLLPVLHTTLPTFNPFVLSAQCSCLRTCTQYPAPVARSVDPGVSSGRALPLFFFIHPQILPPLTPLLRMSIFKSLPSPLVWLNVHVCPLFIFAVVCSVLIYTQLLPDAHVALSAKDLLPNFVFFSR